MFQSRPKKWKVICNNCGKQYYTLPCKKCKATVEITAVQNNRGACPSCGQKWDHWTCQCGAIWRGNNIGLVAEH